MSWWDYGHRFITGIIITQAPTRVIVELGDLEPKRHMCFIGDGVEGHLHVAMEGNAGEQYVYGHGENVSMQEWADLILAIGADRGYWELPEIVQDPDRFRPGDSEVMELLVGFEKLKEQTGWEPRTTWEQGIGQTIDWYEQHGRE